MPHPDVSIVIPSRGGAHRLPRLMAALAGQQGPSWEAIVVLDGDIDGSEGILKRVARDLPVQIITFAQNKGRSAALNAGFHASSGAIFVRCDDDLVPNSSYIAHHARAHEHRDAGVVGLYRNIYPETAYARAYGRDWDMRFRRDAYAATPDNTWQYWAGNVSVSRDTWWEVGPYDTDYRNYGWEDVDWGYRLHLLGKPIVLDRALETAHHIAATTTASRSQRAYYSGAARRRFEHKHSLPPLTQPNGGAWSWAVRFIANRLNEPRATSLGRTVDVATMVLPGTLARKGVALAVESSALAGNRAGQAGGAI